MAKARAIDQTSKLALLQRELMRADTVFDIREFPRWERRQGKATAAAAQRCPRSETSSSAPSGRDLQISASLRAGTVIFPASPAASRFTRPTSSTSRSVPVMERRVTVEVKEHIGEHWQRLATLDNPGYQVEGFEERIARDSKFHRLSFNKGLNDPAIADFIAKADAIRRYFAKRPEVGPVYVVSRRSRFL
jgi:hypothetical protein